MAWTTSKEVLAKPPFAPEDDDGSSHEIHKLKTGIIMRYVTVP
jgi:hypothetical protein